MTKILSQNVVAVALLLGVIAGAPILGGCGGGRASFGDGSNLGRKVGSMTFKVKWPAPSRLIPLASNAIKITVSRNGNPVVSKTIVKPGDYTESSPPSVVSFTDLEVGDSESRVEADRDITYGVTAVAFPSDPEASPTPVAQATGSETVSLSTNDPAKSITITMGSTIDKVVVKDTDHALANPIVAVGRTVNLEATAYNAAGEIVLTDARNWSWTTSTSEGGSLDLNSGSPTVVFTGSRVNRRVDTTVRAVEAESGKESTIEIDTVKTGLMEEGSPKFHANVGNTGVAVGGDAIVAEPSARVITGGAEFGLSSPAIAANGDAYIGSLDGNLYAFDAAGRVKWTVAVGGPVEASPVIAWDGTVLVGSETGTVVAVEDKGTTGELKWSVNAGGAIVGSPTLDQDGYLYVAAGSAVRKYDPYTIGADEDPKVVWSFATGAAITAHLALDEADTTSSLYVVDSAGVLTKVDLVAGTSSWSYSAGAPVFSSAPAVARSASGVYVVFGTLQGTVHCVKSTSGTSEWTDPVDLGSPVYATPAVAKDGGTVFVATYDNVSGNTDGGAVAALKTGNAGSAEDQVVWKLDRLTSGFDAPRGYVASPVVSADGSTLYLLSDARTGKKNAYGVAIDSLGSSPVIRWSTAVGEGGDNSDFFDSTPAVGKDGALVVGGVSGKVYSIK